MFQRKKPGNQQEDLEIQS